jgi:XTP/dITP diphosphohydrolase
MKRIIAATRNEGKIREMNAITEELGIAIISRDEAGVPPVEIEETGTTFEENSYIKAKAIMEMTGEPALADDSGICCDYLGGAAGVQSARWSGGDDEDNNAKLVRLTEPVPPEERIARYVCVMTLVYPDGETLRARGEIEGMIITEPRGDGGFGYDPYFVPRGEGVAPGETRTFAEFPAEEKNAISHRRRALDDLVAKLG